MSKQTVEDWGYGYFDFEQLLKDVAVNEDLWNYNATQDFYRLRTLFWDEEEYAELDLDDWSTLVNLAIDSDGELVTNLIKPEILEALGVFHES